MVDVREEFTTIKVPKRLKRLLHSLKARLAARKKRRVTDVEVVAEGLREVRNNIIVRETKEHKSHRKDPNKPSAWEMAGFIKGGKPFSSAKETDKIVYGL